MGLHAFKSSKHACERTHSISESESPQNNALITREGSVHSQLCDNSLAMHHNRKRGGSVDRHNSSFQSPYLQNMSVKYSSSKHKALSLVAIDRHQCLTPSLGNTAFRAIKYCQDSNTLAGHLLNVITACHLPH